MTITLSPSPPQNAWTRDLPWIDREDADVEGYVARLSRRPNYDLAEKLSTWRERGVVIFENVVAKSQIDKLLEDIAHFRARFGDYEIPIEIRGRQLQSTEAESFPLDETGVKINHLHCFSRAAARLSLTREVVDFLGHIFGGPAAVTQSLTFWRGSEQPIHIDYPYVRQQKRLAYVAASWIPLEDIHPDAGPLAYYSGGHRPEMSGFFDWGGGEIIYDPEKATRTPSDFAQYLAARMTEMKVEPTVFCPKKGDVLLWHGNLPHEGTKVRNRELTRKSYVTHYTSLRDLPGWMRVPAAQLLGAGVFENGGYAFEFPWVMRKPKLPSW